ncbi:hypothetical protein PCE1_003570 [Barthelona sp. PCE]
MLDLIGFKGLIGYAVYFVIICIICVWQINKLADPEQSEGSSKTVAAVGMIIAFMALSIIPIDVFNVNNADAVSWDVYDTRATTIKAVYIIVFVLMILYMFVLVPLVYFYYEEGEIHSSSDRMRAAIRYTVMFLVILLILIVAGIFFGPSLDNLDPDLDWAKKVLSDSLTLNALYFVVGIFAAIGVVIFVLFTGFGMAWIPIRMMALPCLSGESFFSQEKKSLNKLINSTSRNEPASTTGRFNAVSKKRSSYGYTSVRTVNDKQKALEEKISKYDRNRKLLAPFSVILGILLFFSNLCIVIALAFTALGTFGGADFAEYTNVNFVDKLIGVLIDYTPMDFIAFSVIILLLFFITMQAIIRLDIGCLVCSLFKLEKKKSDTQALLLFGVYMAFFLFAQSQVLYTLTPQYATFGSLTYINETTIDIVTGETHNVTLPCSWSALNDTRPLDPSAPSLCVPSEMAKVHQSLILNPIFKQIFTYANVGFIAIYVLATFYSLVTAMAPKKVEEDELRRPYV